MRNISTWLSKLRALRDFAGPLISTQDGDPAMLAQWRRDEVFDPGERVNAAHSPLTCGDVFIRTNSSQVFVLLGQPCDMAVRQNGSRNTHEAIFVKAEKQRIRDHSFGSLLFSDTGFAHSRE